MVGHANALTAQGGTVVLCEVVAGWITFAWSDLIRSPGQLSEGSRYPQFRGFFDSEFVVAAAEVLHECVPGADHPGAAELFEAAYRPQLGLESAVVGFERVIRVLLHDMACGGHQFIQCPWVGGRAVGSHLSGRCAVRSAWVKNRQVAVRSRFSTPARR